MKEQTAQSLALKLSQTWQRGPLPDIWAEVLQTMEHGPAEAAYRALRDTMHNSPSIAEFRTAYAKQLGTAHRDPDHPHDCAECCDTGWVTDLDHPRHWPGRPGTIPVARDADGNVDPRECICNVARPCHCRAGQAHRTRKEAA